MRRIIVTCLVLLLSRQNFLHGQEKLTDSLATITILSTEDSIDVFDGSRCIGTTPVAGIIINAGLHIFRYAPAGRTGWNPPVLSESVFVPAGDSLLRHIDLPAQYRVTSEPYGAAIIKGDSILAYTPSIISLSKTIKNIRLRKPGYEEAEILLTRTIPDIHAVLTPNKGMETAQESIDLVQSSERNNVPVYATASIAVISGVVAAICKINADRYYDDYRITGNEENISKIHSFDRISGISMAVEEISLVALAYLLFKR
jgi:hypothetical protein